MAVKPETTFIASIHRLLPDEIHREKMNNPYRSGTADVWYSGHLDLWAEYKYVPSFPVRSALIPDLSPLQLDWCTKRRAQGRSVIVIVGCKSGGLVLTDPHHWLHGVMPGELPTLTRRDIASRITAHCQGKDLLVVSNHGHQGSRPISEGC
jgi:hypothetical protein